MVKAETLSNDTTSKLTLLCNLTKVEGLRKQGKCLQQIIVFCKAVLKPCKILSVYTGDLFHLVSFSVREFQEALKTFDQRKPSDADLM